MPRVVPRDEWDPAPLVAGTRYRGRLKDVLTTIVVHHSDFLEPPGPLGIKQYHLEVSGFSDIGYHFVIEPDGTVYEGRPLDRMGA
ncbi:MAG: N-acetylmuramoyl-L-alanine amidase, partial [Deltaproteobacteria bacterium]|nr:N-acetylmuramoyl-L-alanine amidase [Deltaproteobacteria bacterium]